jgi:IS6 family transposase
VAIRAAIFPALPERDKCETGSSIRYGLSYRDAGELLAERGVTVDHVSIYRWVQRFTPEFAGAARPCRHVPGDRWFVDETYLKIAGRWSYLYRAVDQHGQVIDVLLST